MKIAVIGGGPGGYEAAIYAAKCGAEVTLIEKGHVGGTCLNKGCIPTKSFLASSTVLKTVNDASDFGVNIQGEVEVNYGGIVQRKDKIVTGLVSGVEFLLNHNNVTLKKGKGKLINNNTIQITNKDGSAEEIKADKIILATGSMPVIPDFLKYDGKRVITSDELLNLKEYPKSIIIAGGGVIGCEFGQFLSKMGSSVTIVELMPHILPLEDDDTARQLKKQFRKDKVKVYEGNGISNVEVTDSGVDVTLQDGKEIEADYMLISVGRKPYTTGLGLENIGIRVDKKGSIPVNKYLETEQENIYAIGDLIATPLLAHVASKEGMTAVDNALGKQKVGNFDAVPRCIYTEPEIAAVGLTENQLISQNKKYKKGTFSFMGLGKAKVTDRIAGFTKVIVDEEDRIVGAVIVGDHATDMLPVLTLAVDLGLTSEQVGNVIYPHPTMSEGIMEALHDVHGKSIHKV